MRKRHLFFFSILVTVQAFFPATTDAARGRVKIGVSSKGALTVLTDRGTLLRGKDIVIIGGQTEAESCFKDARDLGLNCINLRCEDEPIVGGVREWERWTQYVDDAINWCEKYDLYAIILYSSGYMAQWGDGRDKFWEYMAPKYKDRTHVIYQPENEAWTGDSSIALIKRVRAWAPQMHIIAFTFPGNPQINSEYWTDINYAKSKGIDFSNLSIGYHTYSGESPDGCPPENLAAWKASGFALIMTEYFRWAEVISQHEKVGISWILFRGDNSDAVKPLCNFASWFSGTVMPKAIQLVGQSNVCWMPDYGAVPSCNTPSGPYIWLSKTSIASTIAKGQTLPPDTVNVLGANMGTATLADVTTSIAYASGNGWLSVSRLGSGNQQQLVNTISSAPLSAGTFSATVTVSAASVQQATYTVQLTVVEPRSPENPATTTPGLAFSYYEGSWTNLPTFATLTPVKSGVTPTVSLSSATAADNFALHFTGFINAPATGEYTFTLSSDDGSKIYIGSQVLINNDGPHAIQTGSASIVLGAGKHAITIDYFEAAGDQSLSVTWEGPGIATQTIPASVLFHSDATSAFPRSVAGDLLHPMTLFRSRTGLQVTVAIDAAYTLEVFGWNGRRLYSCAGRGAGIVHLSKAHFPAATCLVKLSGPAGVIVTSRFVR